jgi:hypothetical protein
VSNDSAELSRLSAAISTHETPGEGKNLGTWAFNTSGIVCSSGSQITAILDENARLISIGLKMSMRLLHLSFRMEVCSPASWKRGWAESRLQTASQRMSLSAQEQSSPSYPPPGRHNKFESEKDGIQTAVDYGSDLPNFIELF